MRRTGITGWVLFFMFMLLMPEAAGACTLWGAAGAFVQDGGTLLVKNRDWRPDHRQKLELVSGSGILYLALVAEGNQSGGAKAGVNAQGLSVVSASPPAYLEHDKTLPRTRGLIRKMLSRCRSVEEALAMSHDLVGPQFLLLADKQEIACVEIGLDGQYRVERSRNGTLAHTNHYGSPDLTGLNRDRIGASSQQRRQAIEADLSVGGPFSPEDFQRFSLQQDAGPDNSIWRTGSRPDGTRTLATWMVGQPEQGEAFLFLRLNNPGEECREYRWSLADLFSGKIDLSAVK